MSEISRETEAFIRKSTRFGAVVVPVVGVGFLVVGIEVDPHPAKVIVGIACIAAGPIFWLLAGRPLAVLGASGALLLAGIIIALTLTRETPSWGFDLALGIVLAAVAIWTLIAHARGAKE